MAHNSCAIRSSHSSHRGSSHSLPAAPASPHHSSSPSDPNPSPSDHDALSHPPGEDLSPSKSGSVTGYPSPLFPYPHPIYTSPPSAATCLSLPATHQAYSSAPQLAHLGQLPAPEHLYQPPHLATIDPFLTPTTSHPIHLLSNSQTLGADRLEQSIQQNCSLYEQAPRGQASTFQTPRYRGMFSGSHHLSFTDNTFIDNNTTSDNFMKEFLQHTIIGAEFDSSDRHPPPRCHPGTRLAIVERCKAFIVQCDGKEKMRWVVGPAGVGKSAIMQIVAEDTPADASVFLSMNGRQDGTKTFTTIAYQLAVKHEVYRQFVRQEISRDPSLFRKSLPVQFQKFIIDPFIQQQLLNHSHRFLIIVDGLDECDNPRTQREVIGLISHFCISYPTSPIVWFVASRPEPHITSFFDDIRVTPAYTKEEILMDSDDACQDVQRYLRDELNEIKLAYPTLRHKRQWPSEHEFTRIATAAGGLFAYASTVVRYIDDPYYRDPAARLRHILETIDAGPTDNGSGRDHPMAQLDALYKRVLSNIPPDAMMNARKLLFIHSDNAENGHFRFKCNTLGLTEDDAYGAAQHLHAVAKVPAPDESDTECLAYYHKSFTDFLLDFTRSGLSHNAYDETDQLLAQCIFRIVDQVPDDFYGTGSGEAIECFDGGDLKVRTGLCDNISLSWPGDERYQITDVELRFSLYRYAMTGMFYWFTPSDKFCGSMSCFHALTTRFSAFGHGGPVYQLRDAAFDHFCPGLTKLGKLKKVPLRTLDYSAICGKINLRFTSLTGLSNPWNASCKHRKENLDDLQQWRGWSTSFSRFPHDLEDGVTHTVYPRFNVKAGKDSHWDLFSNEAADECRYCLQLFSSSFINSQDQLATVFVDSTGMCYVEWSFVDPDDGMSEWRYRFFHSGPPATCIV